MELSIKEQLDMVGAIRMAERPLLEHNYTHEVAFLQLFCAQRSAPAIPGLSSFDQPSSALASVFSNSSGHDCLAQGCSLQSLPVSIKTFECPLEPHHPADEPRHPDGHIQHKVTHAVFICPTTGKVHICTPGRCEYKYQPAGTGVGEYACPLTAISLGSDYIGTVEYKDNRRFTDGEAMTWQEHIDHSKITESRVVQRFDSARADNVESERNAALDTTLHGERRRMLASLPERAGAQLAIESAPVPGDKRTAVMAGLAVRYAKVPALPDIAPAVRAKFIEDIETMITQLLRCINREEAIQAVRRRACEVGERLKNDAQRQNGRAAQGRSKTRQPLILHPTYALAIFDSMMSRQLDEYEWVCRATDQPDWKSGALFEDRRKRLLARMTRLWAIYSTTAGGVPAKMYQNIGLPMLSVLCEGYKLDVNAAVYHTEDGTAKARFSLHRPGNKLIKLTVIEPDPDLHEMPLLELLSHQCSGPGSAMKMSTSIHACYKDLFTIGVAQEDVQRLIVPHSLPPLSTE